MHNNLPPQRIGLRPNLSFPASKLRAMAWLQTTSAAEAPTGFSVPGAAPTPSPKTSLSEGSTSRLTSISLFTSPNTSGATPGSTQIPAPNTRTSSPPTHPPDETAGASSGTIWAVNQPPSPTTSSDPKTKSSTAATVGGLHRALATQGRALEVLHGKAAMQRQSTQRRAEMDERNRLIFGDSHAASPVTPGLESAASERLVQRQVKYLSQRIVQLEAQQRDLEGQSNGTHALSSSQERKLVAYLDDQFLQLTRGYKKRSEPTTHLPTLHDYLDASRKLLSVILQIPPIDPSTSLRTAFLLRLTNDTLMSIPGYPPTDKTLPEALDWFDDLDQAWLTVLQAQVWDSQTGAGVDLHIDAADATAGVKSSPVSQTERTRLRSLLVGSAAALEEWLETQKEREGDEDIEMMLQRLGLQAEFDDLFSRTLDYLGGLGGVMVAPI
ncbi:hypothetical protein LshimejAT787_0211650 [Lyophyllum shimeji]|uniref:Uncharacterized protein n=1 Tax=Lyophyllum shimeji TaxID=47721 RepID=A0A9P3PGL3_LYOSH|nr:hypothetical protein LshimejAT787_0211650 [Lyophyllum shimeji]